MHSAVAIGSSAGSNPAKVTRYTWGIAIAAALGGLLFGYDWVVIGGARQFYEIYFQLSSTALIGWANSCALLGCLIGSLLAGYLAQSFGRRRVLLIAAVMFAISSVLTGWAYSFTAFIFWRIAGGVAIGLSSNVSPLYIAEISPAAIRGRLVSLNQFAIVVGILLAQIANWRIAQPVDPHATSVAILHSWNVLYAWRWMFTVLVIPAMVFMCASFFIPESPRWLCGRGRNAEAGRVLERIGGAAYAAEELAGIERALRSETEAATSSWSDLFSPGTRRVLLIGCGLAVLQQWTGINILFNYAAEVYRSAGYGANDIFLNIVITGTINLVFTILAMLLVDRIGRRKLMMAGCIGIAIAHLLCFVAYREHWPGSVILVMTLGAISCYAVTLAPVTWVLISEIFPNRVRSQGVSAAASALWIASFALTYTFPIMNRSLGTAGVFLTYSAVCIAGLGFVFAMVPETKGRTLEEIGERAEA
jgi:SP family xylose:H+ symportor-like MFS transporter